MKEEEKTKILDFKSFSINKFSLKDIENIFNKVIDYG